MKEDSSKVTYPNINATTFIRGNRPQHPDKLPITTAKARMERANETLESSYTASSDMSPMIRSYRNNTTSSEPSILNKSLFLRLGPAVGESVAISHRLAARHAASTCSQGKSCLRRDLVHPWWNGRSGSARSLFCLTVRILSTHHKMAPSVFTMTLSSL